MDNDKTILVLGASAGVGAEIALEFWSRGYHVIGFHRGHYPEYVHRLSLLDNITYIQSDAGTSMQSMMVAAGQLRECLAGRKIDIVVHALSGAAVGPALTMNFDSTSKTFNRLAHSFLWWAQWLEGCDYFSADSQMWALTSPCPDFYLKNTGVIGAAKGALEGYVRILAAELPHTRVNALKFSTVRTPALDRVLGETDRQRLKEVHDFLLPKTGMLTVYDIGIIFYGLTQIPLIDGAIIDATGGAVNMLMDYAFNGGTT